MNAAITAATLVTTLAAAARLRPGLTPIRGRAPRRRRVRQRRPTSEQWASLLDTTSAEVRSGATLTAAWEASLRRHQPQGASIRASTRVADLAHLCFDDGDEAVVAQVVHAAAALGGPQSATIDAGAALLRERSRVRAESLAHAAQARISARVLSVLPVVFVAWSVATSASFRSAIVGPIGRWCAVTGIASNVIGWQWMRRLIARASR